VWVFRRYLGEDPFASGGSPGRGDPGPPEPLESLEPIILLRDPKRAIRFGAFTLKVNELDHVTPDLAPEFPHTP